VLQRRRNAPRIDREDAIPFLEVEIGGLMPWRDDTGVGDDDVEPAESRDRGGDGGCDVLLMADIGDPGGEALR
jgi:hypothetical protein